MTNRPLFKAVYPYRDSVLTLPVTDLDEAATRYSRAFGMVEVERADGPDPAVILERDGVRLGFAVNGGDASQDGAAILVSDIERARSVVEKGGLSVGETKTEERDGQQLRVFFVVAPD